jgi:hypothetical protein
VIQGDQGVHERMGCSCLCLSRAVQQQGRPKMQDGGSQVAAAVPCTHDVLFVLLCLLQRCKDMSDVIVCTAAVQA